MKAHPAAAGAQRLAQGEPRERHGQPQDGLGWAAGAAAAPGCAAGAPRVPPAARDNSQVTGGSAKGKELLGTAAPPRRFGLGNNPGGSGGCGGTAWAGSGTAVPSRTGRFRQSHRGFGAAGGGRVRAQRQDGEVKSSGSISVPSLLLRAPSAPSPCPDPCPVPQTWLGVSKAFPALVPHLCQHCVLLGVTRQGPQVTISRCAHTGVSQVGTSACGAPGAAPTARISQCGSWSHWATKLPVFLPKTAPPRLPRPLLPLFSPCSSSEPAPEAAGPAG